MSATVRIPLVVERLQRTRVTHLYWTDSGRAAAELGVDHKMMCGVWRPPPADTDVVDRNVLAVLVVGSTEAVPLYEVRDCRNCRRVFDAYVRRALRSRGPA